MPAQRVLYIDDDPGLSRLVQRFLGRRGYEVELASSAEDGLARLEAERFDVVGLDHYLPTGTGLDVLALLSKAASPPPVVYVTGSAETAVAVAALKAGASDYVAKTADSEFFELLASAIDQAIERSRLQRAKEQAERETLEAKERAELLLAEVNHRVANSLALVAALVRMQSHALKEPAAKEALAETEARIAAVAGVHRRLYTSDDVSMVDSGEYLKSLVLELEASMQTSDRSALVKLRSESIPISTDKAVSLGVIVTELVTNALKYAYPDPSGGEVRISLAHSSPTRALLAVEDDGIGWRGQGQVRGTGVGSRIVKAMAGNLGTEIVYCDQAIGTRAEIEFAL
jgi:two-component sensor histidine kinase/CheY-like chemotaxis protein